MEMVFLEKEIMNIAYFIYHGIYVENDMFDVCIRSLKKQSNCKIVVYTCELDNQELLKSRGVEVINFPKEDWDDRKMTCKIEKAHQMVTDLKLNEGDNLLSFDADLIFLKDPFDVFNNDFEFFSPTNSVSLSLSTRLSNNGFPPVTHFMFFISFSQIFNFLFIRLFNNFNGTHCLRQHINFNTRSIH